MTSLDKLSLLNRRAAIICASLVTFIGLLFFITKYLKIPFFTQLFFEAKGNPQGSICFIGSICLILCGAAFFSLIFWQRFALHRWLAVALIVFSTIQFFEFFILMPHRLFQAELGFIIYPCISMLNFLLIGFGFLFWPRNMNVRYSSLVIVNSYVILFLYLFYIILIAIPFASNYVILFISHHFMIVLGQLIFSIGMICWIFFQLNNYKIKMVNWLPLIVIALTGIFSIFLLYSLFLRSAVKILNDGEYQIERDTGILLSVGLIAISLLLIMSIYLFNLYRDRSDLIKKVKDQLTIYKGISNTLFATDTVEEASQKMLDILYAISNWQVLIYWSWNDKQQALILNTYVSIPGKVFFLFEKASRELIVSEKKLLHAMFENQEPLWFQDFSKEGFSRSFAAQEDELKGAIGIPVFGKNFSRVLAAQEEEIKGAFVTPVFEKDRLIGLVELFRTEPLESEPNEEWIEFMRNIGNEFTLFLERKQACLLHEKLKIIFNNSIDAIYSFDENLLITEWNYSAETLYGWSQKEAIGMSLEVLYPVELLSEFQLLKEQFQKNLSYQHGQVKRVCKNGRIIWVDLIYSPILKELGETTIISKDVTELKRIDQSKNEFISMVSHELRTPLTTVIGALGLMNDHEQIPPDLKELFLLAKRNADRLILIINDILDIERSQLGKLQLSLKQISLNKVVHEAVVLTEVLAKESDITLIEDLKVPNIQILADEDRLLQVLLNLLSNAIKFSSPKGKVILAIELNGEKVRVSVQDFGHGIPIEVQPKVFEKFFQVEGGDARLKGTGLGLHICKNLLEQMNATIGFDSVQSKGSTFYFEFRVKYGE